MSFKNPRIIRLAEDFSRELKIWCDEEGGVDEVAFNSSIPQSTMRSYTNPGVEVNMPAIILGELPLEIQAHMMRWISKGSLLVLPTEFSGLDGQIDDELDELVEEVGKLFAEKRSGRMGNSKITQLIVSKLIHLSSRIEVELTK